MPHPHIHILTCTYTHTHAHFHTQTQTHQPTGQDLSEDDVKAFIKGQVAEYKQLAEVQFLDAIPKAASGKILRRVLRDMTKKN